MMPDQAATLAIANAREACLAEGIGTSDATLVWKPAKSGNGGTVEVQVARGGRAYAVVAINQCGGAVFASRTHQEVGTA